MISLIESIIVSIQSNITYLIIALSTLVVVYIVSLAVIFSKIGHKPAIAFIPIYNIMSLLAILKIPQWMVLLMFIPFVNIPGLIFMTLLIGYKLGTLCRKNIIIKLGLMVLPPIFYPLLAFTEIDIDGNKNNYVSTNEGNFVFSLSPVDFGGIVDVPNALNLSDAENIDKITIKKVQPKVEKVETPVVTATTIAEHLAKANKDMPTAQDLTFDYNLIYNSVEVEEEIVEEVQEEIPQPSPELTVINEVVVEEQKEEIEEYDDTPIIPVIHDVVLGEAEPIDETNIGPVPINNRYENQLASNRRQKEALKEKEKQKIEEIKEEFEPVTVVIENGPIEIDSSLAGLVAASPDFNVPIKIKEERPQIEEIVIEPVSENIPTTEVQEIVSMDIVEPSQLPVGVVPDTEEDVVEELTEQIAELPQESVSEQNTSLLRPVITPESGYALVDKTCPQCNAKLKRDCPVCIICGYRF